ncbi:MAG: InlB B-repeat-containing protein [Clostridia bacterium]|nr:InlB B-repeat-containing protein [Clostridia bacterium]
MKILKRIIMTLVVAMLLTICLSGCDLTMDEMFNKSGDFYYLIKEDEETGEKYVTITGLTEVGEKKDVIVIPPVLDGYPVWSLGSERLDLVGFGKTTYYVHGDYTKIYVPSSFKKVIVDDVPIGGLNLHDYVFNCGMQFEFLGDLFFNTQYTIYNPPINVYLPELECLKDREKYENVIFIKANLQYDYNIPNITVKHFIDNVPTGSKISAPPYEPEREGYKFAGWYKEPECINAWDFETDVTETVELAEGEEITEEIMQLENYATTLYAKWEIA